MMMFAVSRTGIALFYDSVISYMPTGLFRTVLN